MARWASLDDLLEATGEIALPFEPPITVASRNGDDDTPLHVAAIWGDAEAVEMLVCAGADVNAVDEMGYTPLLYAVTYSHIAAARALIMAGASGNIRCEFGNTATEMALGSGNAELVALFAGGEGGGSYD